MARAHLTLDLLDTLITPLLPISGTQMKFVTTTDLIRIEDCLIRVGAVGMADVKAGKVAFRAEDVANHQQRETAVFKDWQLLPHRGSLKIEDGF